MKELLPSFKKSLARLVEVLAKEKTIEHRDAAIQRFEFTSELAWKMVQRFLREQKIVCRSPKACLEEVFRFGLIQDDPRWIQMLEDRNLTVHTYDETTAEKVYERLPRYLEILQLLQDALERS